jgi:putative addiction module component (TIGR02574 family)
VLLGFRASSNLVPFRHDAERLALASELLESVEGPEEPEWADAWAAELDRRVRELDEGRVQGVPWSEVKANMERGCARNEACDPHAGCTGGVSGRVEWYEGRVEGLGLKCLLVVDEALQAIEESPSAYPRWERDARFRKFVIQRFPYVVFYREVPNRST